MPMPPMLSDPQPPARPDEPPPSSRPADTVSAGGQAAAASAKPPQVPARRKSAAPRTDARGETRPDSRPSASLKRAKPRGPQRAKPRGSVPSARPVPAAEPADDPPPPGTRKLLLEFLRKRQTVMAANLLKACTDGDIEAIHDVRVASRRLSEPLALLGPDLPAARFRKLRISVRRVRRAFQVVRDLDVMGQALGKIAKAVRNLVETASGNAPDSAAAGKGKTGAGNGKGAGVLPPGLSASSVDDALRLVIASMKSRRAAAFDLAVAAAHDRRTFKMQAALQRLADTGSPVRASPPPAPGAEPSSPGAPPQQPAIRVADDDEIARRADRLVTDRIAELAAEAALLSGTASPAVAPSKKSRATPPAPVAPAGDPHQVRIAAKRLRYALELAKAVGRPIPPDSLDTLRGTQELLGRWHDEVVLAEELSRNCFLLPRLLREPVLSAALLGLAADRLRRAAGELDEFHRSLPALWTALGR